MKERSFSLFVEDILNAMARIDAYTRNLDYDAFAQDQKSIDAVVRNLKVIGEVAKNIPDSVKHEYSEIPWKRMVGLRNIVVHEYFGIDLEIIWKIVTENLPNARLQIEKMQRNF